MKELLNSVFKKASFFTVLGSIFLVSVVFLFPLSGVYAQQGCCSWHGGIAYCDTSTGRYVCNDGTYSPTCRCTYIPPAPVCDLPGSVREVTYESEVENEQCTSYKVIVHWSSVYGATGYSISLDGNPSADPGLYSDTSGTQSEFSISPGISYFHIRAINSCGAGDLVHHTIEIVVPKPEINTDIVEKDGKTFLTWDSTCASKVECQKDGAVISLEGLDGSVEITDTKDVEYTIIAYGVNDQVVQSREVYSVPEPEEAEESFERDLSQSNVNESSDKPETKEASWWDLLACLEFLSCLFFLCVSPVVILYVVWKKRKS